MYKKKSPILLFLLFNVILMPHCYTVLAANFTITHEEQIGLKADRNNILDNIDKSLKTKPKVSEYLYETDSTRGKIVGVWTEMTALILGTKDLRQAYDNFYQSSVEYAAMVEINLYRARKAALKQDAETASHYLEAARRYEKQFYLNDKAAKEVFNGEIDAASELAKGIYNGSKASVIYGSSMVLTPVSSRVVDTIFDVTDFAVEASDNGLKSATNQLVADKVTEIIFSHIKFNEFGNRTLKDAMDQGITKSIGSPEVYKIVQHAVSKPEFTKTLMSFIARSGSHVATEITEKMINKIIATIMGRVESKLPPLTVCGSKDEKFQRIFLQVIEAKQATLGGYSFDVACQAHDTCYGNCETPKSDCDKKLRTNARLTCESAIDPVGCMVDAELFLLAVSIWGDDSFRQARKNCPNVSDFDDTCHNIKSDTPKPLATAIVFDKSGSMADERKIDFAREASFTYAREMKAEDLLSLSTFSSDAGTPAGLEIKNKEQISPKLAEILPTLQPDGQTNIGAGLASGLNQLCSVPSDQVKKGALLLSDGMNNVGSYEAVVTEYRDLGIPIYTVKFGREASEKDLRDIAAKTSGIYLDSDTTNLTDAYRYIYAAINGDSVRIASHDPMGPKDSLAYEVDVSQDAKALQIGTSWQGSRLKTVLTSPSGVVYSGNQLPSQADRFEAGPITQFTQINAPESGRWQIDLTWDDPPPAAERVNLFVSEHSDVYVSLYGFSPEYTPGQQVTINVHAAELDGGNNKIPLKNARVRARVQVPGPEVIRLIQAQGSNVRISEDISQEIYREVELFDDGQHADYNEGDGIFGGFFPETHLKGSYIVSAHIEGERTNGAHISRDSRGAFHVGSLMDNVVFTSDLMLYAQQLEERMKTKVVSPLGKMQGNPASDVEIPASGKKTQSRSLMDSISN